MPSGSRRTATGAVDREGGSSDLARHEAEFLLYQIEDGRTRVEGRFDGETAWLSLGQMAELFQRDETRTRSTGKSAPGRKLTKR